MDAHPYLKGTAVEIAGQALATDSPTLFESRSAIELIGSDMTRQAARQAYKQAGIRAKDVSVVELHDCFTTNEMCALEGLDLAREGTAWKLVRDGGITYGPDGSAGLNGKGWVVNPSGGLISKGHPLGATGLAQCAELSKYCKHCVFPHLELFLTLLKPGIFVAGPQVALSKIPSIAYSTTWDLEVPLWLQSTNGPMARLRLR